MNRAHPLVFVLAAIVSACGGSSPAAPTPAPIPAPAPTRVVNISGDLAFGAVNIGESATRTYTITNSGTAPLTVTSIQAVGGTGIAGFSATVTSGTIAAGASLSGTLRFTPTAAQFYSNISSVIGDYTSGNASINVSGTGVNNSPLFTKSGMGANVFDMPTTVTRVRVFGDYGGNCENFIIHVGGRTLVNEILGSCSVATSGRHFDGTFVTAGGVTEVLNSSGISWTFVEVR